MGAKTAENLKSEKEKDMPYILSKHNFLHRLGSLIDKFNLIGPVVKKRSQVVFEKTDDPFVLDMDYCSTMLSPRNFIYPQRENLFKINRETQDIKTEPENLKPNLIVGIHPCDMHAITVLDLTFLGDFKDFYYAKHRNNTFNIVLNCNKACNKGFCASMGTGPFLRIKQGYDLELTDTGKYYLIESGSQAGMELIKNADGLQKTAKKDIILKKQLEKTALDSFKKHIDVKGLPELLAKNLDHPVYENTADSRCLGCTNCTMVCPTCYCYNLEDYTLLDLKTTIKKRHWDSCQELNFAGVHSGNFRSSRKARLRQFVTHKLGTWIEQYGCFGCIGCGRCMSWCPTEIDLTDMAKEIRKTENRGQRTEDRE